MVFNRFFNRYVYFYLNYSIFMFLTIDPLFVFLTYLVSFCFVPYTPEPPEPAPSLGEPLFRTRKFKPYQTWRTYREEFTGDS